MEKNYKVLSLEENNTTKTINAECYSLFTNYSPKICNEKIQIETSELNDYEKYMKTFYNIKKWRKKKPFEKEKIELKEATFKPNLNLLKGIKKKKRLKDKNIKKWNKLFMNINMMKKEINKNIKCKKINKTDKNILCSV